MPDFDLCLNCFPYTGQPVNFLILYLELNNLLGIGLVMRVALLSGITFLFRFCGHWGCIIVNAVIVMFLVFFNVLSGCREGHGHELIYCCYCDIFQMSYQVVDSLIWLGIRGIINSFRKKQLKLRPITYLSGSQGSIADLPTGYIWSPHLVPKPKGSNYSPPHLIRSNVFDNCYADMLIANCAHQIIRLFLRLILLVCDN